MKLLALDLSTNTGWALFEDGKLIGHGHLKKVLVKDFNVNNHPNKSKLYPKNIVDAAETVAYEVQTLLVDSSPDCVIVENTVKGKNRHTQRLLEYIHFTVSKVLNFKFFYMDPSEWRAVVSLRLSKQDKDNNLLVKKKKKRGKVTRKHLSVRMVNDIFGLSLKIKDNDIADAILLGWAALLNGCPLSDPNSNR